MQENKNKCKEDYTKKLQNLVKKRATPNVVFEHCPYKKVARRSTSTSPAESYSSYTYE